MSHADSFKLSASEYGQPYSEGSRVPVMAPEGRYVTLGGVPARQLQLHKWKTFLECGAVQQWNRSPSRWSVS